VLGVALGIVMFATPAGAQGGPEGAPAQHDNEVAVSAQPEIREAQRNEVPNANLDVENPILANGNPTLTAPSRESHVPQARSARGVVGVLPIPERVYAVELLTAAPDLARVPTRPRSVSPWLAAGVALPLQVAIWSWSRLVTRDDWARISLDSWRANLRGPWIFDRSNDATNQFAHPSHGSLSFTAARASGLGFWASLPYPLVASTLWELFGETVPPAINDAITTPVGGALLGEALHRVAAMFLDAGGARRRAHPAEHGTSGEPLICSRAPCRA